MGEPVFKFYLLSLAYQSLCSDLLSLVIIKVQRFFPTQSNHVTRSPKKSKDKKRDRERRKSENGAESGEEEKVFAKPKEKVEPLSLEELLEKKRKEEEVNLI